MDSGGIRIGKVFGIPIILHWSLVLIIVLFGWLLSGFFENKLESYPAFAHLALGYAAAFGLFISVFLHELSHSFVARLRGIRVEKITLLLFGGAASIAGGRDMGAGAEFKMTAVGPLFSIAIGTVLAFAASAVEYAPAHWLFLILAYMNIVIGLFNLVPCFPMDGGRILRSLLWAKTGDFLKATRVAARLTIPFAVILVAFGFLWGGLFSALWIWLLMWFFIIPASKSELRQAELEEAFSGLSISDLDIILPTNNIFADQMANAYERDGIKFISCGSKDKVWDVLLRVIQEKAEVVFVQEGRETVGYFSRQQIISVVERLRKQKDSA